MISNKKWLVLFALSLCCSSFLIFFIHLIIFHDFHHIAIFTLHDLAFLPIEVLLVTLFLHQMMERRAMKNKLNKLNMVIGVFFSEVGTPLIRFCGSFDDNKPQKISFFSSLTTWEIKDFPIKKKEIQNFSYKIQISCNDLQKLRKMLINKRDFLVRLLENPVLLEHESFTEVLQAVFHLTEELHHRGECSNLPGSDISHLSGDITRVYSLMIPIWLSYLEYLKTNYPYLFSLSARTNPFNENEDVIIRE
ncbi:MAG: hypothetical protein GXY48_12690 [Methanomicrobiales archaeon]|nr:hypothetical protein [Methanomicrobiales archaeon]